MTGTKPVTVKGMPAEIWKLAVNGANAADESVADWLARAIVAQAEREKGNEVIPPGKPVSQPANEAASLGDIDLSGIAAVIQATMAAGGSRVAAPLAREASRMLRTRLRAAQGLPPKQTGLPGRQTVLIESDSTEPSEG